MRAPGAADHGAVPEAATVTETGTRGAIHMRKTLATLAVLAAGAVAFGSAASPASADDPNATYSNGGYAGFSRMLGCSTPYKTGVLGQYGAWGYYIDGCTSKLTCPVNPGFFQTRYCTVDARSFIETEVRRGDSVTMNARLRRFDVNGNVYGWSDRSCSGVDTCEVTDSSIVYPGQSASVQCNGVRQARYPDGNRARDYCRVSLSYVS
jgi:hypothetical protein